MPDILALRDERLELGITQMDVAEAVGVHVSTVNRWETLQCNPTRRHLCAYMYAVKVWARNSGQRERKYLPLPREAADVPFVSEIEALDLRARLRRMGLTDLDVAALWNVKRSTAGGKLNGWCRMRVKEHTQGLNYLYELQREVRILKESVYKRARWMLWNYAQRMDKLSALRCMLAYQRADMDCQAQKYGGSRPSAGSYSDPVARRYAVIESTERAVHSLEERVMPVHEVYMSLKNSMNENEREMFLIMERVFMSHDSIEHVSADTGKSVRTLYRRKFDLIQRVGEVLGDRD
ncbi:MAG: helix-turn-helix transcriptional regulator [Synergistaceae bacterium]|nr:helix-turn-helix transcriptional regulator [Synergistaceae bacterium]